MVHHTDRPSPVVPTHQIDLSANRQPAPVPDANKKPREKIKITLKTREGGNKPPAISFHYPQQ